MCKQFVDWDQEVDSGILDSWKHLCKTFSEVSGASFDRKVLCTDLPVQLFVFADTSQDAYGCAIYIVQMQGELKSSLLLSKVKLLPLYKELCLPLSF